MLSSPSLKFPFVRVLNWEEDWTGLDWTGYIYIYVHVYIVNENEKTRQWQSKSHNLCPLHQYEKIRIRWGVTNTDRPAEWIQTPEGEEAVDRHPPMYRPHLPSLLARGGLPRSASLSLVRASSDMKCPLPDLNICPSLHQLIAWAGSG